MWVKPVMIETPRLKLMPATAVLIRVEIGDRSEFTRLFGIKAGFVPVGPVTKPDAARFEFLGGARAAEQRTVPQYGRT